MQNSIKSGCGRRSESDVWTYFVFDAVANRSKCTVVADGETTCGKSLAGKNPFSCDLSARKRNRARVGLERRVFLKLNKRELAKMQI